jgi:hypothetical protein
MNAVSLPDKISIRRADNDSMMVWPKGMQSSKVIAIVGNHRTTS